MKRHIVGACLGLALAPLAAAAQMLDARPFVGVDLGAAIPVNDNFWAHVHEGGVASPYVGYMLDEAFGVQANFHVNALPPDDDDRGWKGEEDVTTLLGLTVGPRLSLPFADKFEAYVTGQGGVFGGVSGRLDNEFDAGVSLGGGIDYYVTERVAISAFGRWNYAFVRPSPRDLNTVGGIPQDPEDNPAEDIKWATTGIGIKYDFKPEKEAPKPAPPVAKKAEPAPVLPPPTKKKLVLRGVNFDFDKSNIRSDARGILDNAISTLGEEKQVTVVVAGHTDAIGSDAYNLKLSQRRAASVREYLVRGGIDADRLSVKAYGESMPVADNDTDEGRAQNRRVELEVQD